MTRDTLEARTTGRIRYASVPEVVEILGLEPHQEGGYFRETYRAGATVPTEMGPRPMCTAILYLLSENAPSRFHRLRSEEIWFFHCGARVELIFLGSGWGTVESDSTDDRQKHPEQRHLLGPESPQVVVPAATWMGARIFREHGASARFGDDSGTTPAGGPGLTHAGGPAGTDPEGRHRRDWALVGCVVSPGFVYEDFEEGDRASLLRDFPSAEDCIQALT